jgi:CHASE2 domain-containing sensor protein
MLKEIATRVWQRIQQRGAQHWLGLLAAILVAMAVGSWLDDQPIALGLRYAASQWLHSANPIGVYPTHSCVVHIGDDLFYGENHARAPFSPKLLGRLLCALDKAEAGVIGIDVELTNPDAQRPIDSELLSEMAEFETCLSYVGERRPIVLPITLRFDGNGFNPTIFGNLLTRKLPALVRVGFVNLPVDKRYLPTYVEDNGRIVEGFALSMARVQAGETAGRLPFLKEPVIEQLNRKPPMVGFLEPDDVPRIDASELLKGTSVEMTRKLRGRAVLIGAHWSRRSRASGEWIDGYATPVGTLRGVMIHENYLEQILHDRAYRLIESPWLYLIKFLALVAIGIVVALAERDTTKILAVTGITVLLIFLTYEVFIATGLTCDVVLPVLLILLEAAADSITEWRRVATAGNRGSREPAGVAT